MRHLPRPQFDVAFVAGLCASSIQNRELRERLKASTAIMSAAEAVYDQNGANGTLFTIPASDRVGALSAAEIIRIYDGTFVKSTKTRHLYEQIKTRPTNDICPCCAQRTVASLDHFLAKTHHSNYGITPINLAPACLECNKIKLALQPQAAGEQTLHPYFDDVDDGRWLYCNLLQSAPASFEFFVQCPTTWSAVKSARTQTHFGTFGLGQLYASHAGEELASMRFALNYLYVKGGSGMVKEHLSLIAASEAAANANSWKLAMYESMRDSDWLCNGGFQ